MSKKQTLKHCSTCGKPTKHVSAGMGRIFTLIAIIFLLPVWVWLALVNLICPEWTCKDCGAKRR